MRHEVVYKLNMNAFGKNFHLKQLTAHLQNTSINM